MVKVYAGFQCAIWVGFDVLRAAVRLLMVHCSEM